MFALQSGIYSLNPSVVNTWDSSHKINPTKPFYGHQFKLVNDNDIETSPSKPCVCYIIPPHLQEKIEKQKLDKAFRKQRKFTIKHEQAFSFRLPHPFDTHADKTTQQNVATTPVQNLVRTVYDAKRKQHLPGTQILSTKGQSGVPGYIETGSSNDESVHRAHDNALHVFLFYLEQYKHNSIDGGGMPLNSTVHFGLNYENAFWNGSQMVYGDGSSLFKPFVNYLDVVGHELTHGVTGNRLEYEGEAGALNEHFSDVMGYLAYMYANKLDFDTATWLLADGILQYKGKGYPLRSFEKPGEAYNIPGLGKDPQPATYGDLYKGADDNHGVHINSGIANRAFYLFAKALGGNPWEIAGLIWFTTMMTPHAFKSSASMKDFANATIKTSDTLFKENQKARDALRAAWKTVEVLL